MKKTLKDFPEILNEWDYSKNIINPKNISYGSAEKYWWICKKGHSYESSPNDKTSKKVSCPYCANQKVLKGYNDLESQHSEIKEYWDYDKNIIKPDEVTSGSNKKAYWICKKNHSYEANVSDNECNELTV